MVCSFYTLLKLDWLAMVCSFYTLVKLDWLSHGVFILHAVETRLAEPWCVHSAVKLDWLSHGVFILHV